MRGVGRARWLPLNLVLGGTMVAGVALVALASVAWTPGSATRIRIPDRFLVPLSHGHVLGTDQFGRDILSMLMAGSRTTLLVGVVAVGIAMVAGVPLGALAAARRRWREPVLRVGDVLFAFPAILLAVMLAAVFRPGTVTAMVAIGVAYVPVFVRVTRAASAQVLTQDYVLAARAAGAGDLDLFRDHVLRNISGVLIVQATVSFALAVLAEAALSYLGLGSQPPLPSWGRMLNEAQNYLGIQPLLALWPGLCIALTVLGLNLLGDGLRDLLDPRLEADPIAGRTA